MLGLLKRRKVGEIAALPLGFLSILALLAIVLPAPAKAQPRGEIQGARGGLYFEFHCGEGRVLVGLRGSVGVLIDSVQAVCARVDAAGGVTEAGPKGPVFGGNRPIDKDAACPPQHAVAAASISETENFPLLGAIRLTCIELANRQDGGAVEAELRGGAHLRGYESPMLWGPSTDIGPLTGTECPNEYAVGIRGRAERYVNAFGLICGAKPAVAAVVDPTAGRTLGKRKKPGSTGSPFNSLVNSDSSFQTFNFPDRYIRHANWLGFVEPSGGNTGSIIYRMVPGLGGRCISLESKDQPGHFLRHKDWRIRLSKLDADPNMRADATFCALPGLASTTGISFEAISAAGHFIRHRNFELWLDRPDGSDQFRNDSTYLAAPPGGAALGVR